MMMGGNNNKKIQIQNFFFVEAAFFIRIFEPENTNRIFEPSIEYSVIWHSPKRSTHSRIKSLKQNFQLKELVIQKK